MTINFLKYTITIYPLHNDSLVKKNERKKTFWKPKTKKKKNTVILSGTTNNQLD